MKKAYLILILSVSVFSYAGAQWTNDPNTNTEVEDSVGYEESVPISVTTSNGRTFVSYFAQYNGSYQMRMQLLDSSGNRLFGPMGLLISNQPQSTAIFRYDMKVDANDNAIVAFQDTRTAGALNVVVYKIDMLGNLLWGANGVQLIDPVSIQGLAPTIGITGAGNVIVGWNASSSGNYKWVAFQKFSSAGALLWGNNLRVIDSTFTHKYSRPTFAPAGTDDILMLYAEETGTGLPPSKMFAQRYDSNGNKVWANAVQVSGYTIPYFFFQKAVSDNNSGFYVGFNTSNVAFPALSDVYMQHIDSSGILWNATGNLACALTNTQKFTATAHIDGANNAVWVLIKTTDVNQNMSGLAIQKFDASGNIMLGANAAQLLLIAAAYHDPNDFCITSDGVISFYTSGNYPNQTLHAVKNDFIGTLQWGGSPIDICTHSAGKDDLTAGLFVNNQVVAVWDDNRNDYGVYAQNITNNGLLGVVSSVQSEINQDQTSFNLFPNPAKDKTNLLYTLSETNDVTVEIISSLGQVVKSFYEGLKDKGSHTLELNTNELESGYYLVRLIGNKDSFYGKLIKW